MTHDVYLLGIYDKGMSYWFLSEEEFIRVFQLRPDEIHAMRFTALPIRECFELNEEESAQWDQDVIDGNLDLWCVDGMDLSEVRKYERDGVVKIIGELEV